MHIYFKFIFGLPIVLFDLQKISRIVEKLFFHIFIHNFLSLHFGFTYLQFLFSHSYKVSSKIVSNIKNLRYFIKYSKIARRQLEMHFWLILISLIC